MNEIMPERRIEVTEYRCNRCTYQWISRTVNEKYKKWKSQRNSQLDYYFGKRAYWYDDFYSEYKPKNCPRCKSNLWDKRYYSDNERGLIAKLTRKYNLINFDRDYRDYDYMPLVLRRFIL